MSSRSDEPVSLVTAKPVDPGLTGTKDPAASEMVLPPSRRRCSPLTRVFLFGCVFLVCLALVSATGVLVTLYARDKLSVRCMPGQGTVEITPSSSALGNFSHWAVSTDAAPCTPVARRVFRKGGKTVDAAIATLLCMGVVIPHSMGMGGGFIATVYSKKKLEAGVLIAREVAPAGASRDMYVKDKKMSIRGGMAIAVPGELRGYAELHRSLNGSLPWKELFEDAIRVARHGFPMGAHLANALREGRKIKGPLADNIRRVFSDPETGELLQEGEMVKQEDLARTLEAVATYGPDYFYHGDFAQSIINEIQENGGMITLDDLANYKVEWAPPVRSRFKGGLTLYSAPPPGSGAVLAFILGIMDQFRSSGRAALPDDVLTLHRFAEACKFAYAKRALLGGAKSIECDELVRHLTSPELAQRARSLIDDMQTFSRPEYYGFVNESQEQDHGTAHATFWGPDGDVIAVSSTVNYYFGSYVRTKTGVVLNNQMDDFSTPGAVNFYGVAPSRANFIAPGKRPMSSMAPVVVVDRLGDVVLALGGTGGSKITSGVALVTMRTLWMGNTIKDAIDYPRLHHQLIPNHLMVESYFPKTYVEALQALGHKVTYPSGRFSIMMGVHARHGNLYANSDFRKGGTVDGE
ncbi:scoloptoxin SSD14-like isoform X2 [Haemaphysalis longicornis]